MYRYIFTGIILLSTAVLAQAESIYYQLPSPYYSANTYPQYVYPYNPYNQPTYTQNNSVWKNIKNYFSGQMTGFTPPIQYQTPIYTPKSSIVEYSSPFGARGYRTNNYGTSSGSRITILD